MDGKSSSGNAGITTLTWSRRWTRGVLLLVALGTAAPAFGIPAFARKYNLRCSDCHEAWPKLNNFGQTFKDNGYQLMTGRDAPIFQSASYFPIMFRSIVIWNRETDNRVATDIILQNPAAGQVESLLATSGFNISGLNIWTAGTLYKNITFAVQPALDNNGTFHLLTYFVRFDNLLDSPWLNLKVGKFELDNLISEERELTLSQTGGFYQNYHFTPIGDSTTFGLGDHQLGAELSGHSSNSYTRYSVAVLNSTNGRADAPTNSYDVYADVTQGFEIPKLGLQRVGVYAYAGERPTFFQTSNGVPIAGTGMGLRSFSRAGVYGLWYLGKFDFSTFYMHGQDNVFLGNNVAANQPFNLPLGAAGPTWNGGFVEAHYTYNPKLIVFGRFETVQMSRQANPTTRRNLGDVRVWTAGYRWYPIMSSRAGLAWHQEYSISRTVGTAPLTGRDDTNSSFLMGFDFDF
jgi:hypothetical protein